MQLQLLADGKRGPALILTYNVRRSQSYGCNEFRGECTIKTVAKRK